MVASLRAGMYDRQSNLFLYVAAFLCDCVCVWLDAIEVRCRTHHLGTPWLGAWVVSQTAQGASQRNCVIFPKGGPAAQRKNNKLAAQMVPVRQDAPFAKLDLLVLLCQDKRTVQ